MRCGGGLPGPALPQHAHPGGPRVHRARQPRRRRDGRLRPAGRRGRARRARACAARAAAVPEGAAGACLGSEVGTEVVSLVATVPPMCCRASRKRCCLPLRVRNGLPGCSAHLCCASGRALRKRWRLIGCCEGVACGDLLHGCAGAGMDGCRGGVCCWCACMGGVHPSGSHYDIVCNLLALGQVHSV